MLFRSINKRVFGVYNSNNGKIYIVNHASGYWDLKVEQIFGNKTKISDVPNNNMLFFNDYDADGNNDFVIIGADIPDTYKLNLYLWRITPDFSSPYYQTHTKLEKEILGGGGVAKSGFANYSDYQSVNLCQLGSLDSEMEVCYNIITTKSSSVDIIATGILNNDFSSQTGVLTGTGDVTGKTLSPFTYDADGDSIFNSGNWEGCIYLSGYYKCYDENFNLVSSFSASTGSIPADYPLEVIVTELDGDTSTPEFLYSNGGVRQINFSGNSSTGLSDWTSTFDNSYHGELIVQDISTDDKNELIYIDSDNLRIYSNDNTPLTFMNFTYYNDTISSVSSSSSSSTTFNATITTPTAFVNNLNDNIGLIVAIFIIIGLIIMTAQMGVNNPLILFFVGILGAIITSVVGLISSGVLVIIIVSAVVLLLLGFTLLKKRDRKSVV